MNLLNLFESMKIWYHGTPEMQLIDKKFEHRTLHIQYITNVKLWNEIQHKLDQIESGSHEYVSLLQQRGTLLAYKTIPSPIFLTDNFSIANSYADDRLAYDYQAAIPGVLKVHVKSGKTLVIYGMGQNFRGITINSVKSGLQREGIDDTEIDTIFSTFDHSIFDHSIQGAGNKISTNVLAKIAYEAGFEIIDVMGIKDSYMGKGPPSTIRIVLNHELLDIL